MGSNEPVRNGCEVMYEIFHDNKYCMLQHMKSSKLIMILAVMNKIYAIAYRSLKNSELQWGLNP